MPMQLQNFHLSLQDSVDSGAQSRRAPTMAASTGVEELVASFVNDYFRQRLGGARDNPRRKLIFQACRRDYGTSAQHSQLRFRLEVQDRRNIVLWSREETDYMRLLTPAVAAELCLVMAPGGD